jgi:hypothetical protein
MTQPRGPAHRVLLIRPWDMSDGVGAGCCGGGSTNCSYNMVTRDRLEHTYALALLTNERCFRHSRV